MVMGLLSGPIIMTYMRKYEIYIIYRTTNASAYITATKHHFLVFQPILGVNFKDPAGPTFEINGHGLLCVFPL